jgi:hypothetical protein
MKAIFCIFDACISSLTTRYFWGMFSVDTTVVPGVGAGFGRDITLEHEARRCSSTVTCETASRKCRVSEAIEYVGTCMKGRTSACPAMSLKESRIPEEASPREFIVSAELRVPSTAALGLRKVCLKSLSTTFNFTSPLFLAHGFTPQS